MNPCVTLLLKVMISTISENTSSNKNKHSISTGAAALISVLAVPVTHKTSHHCISLFFISSYIYPFPSCHFKKLLI